jgi:hypothetical protein
MRGTYCALSNCWGPAEKKPLTTTKDNLQQHLNDIAFERLPKTFQDAVTFARGINIEFIWIDSLCIVQDDDDDWVSEAKEMGKVYGNAVLVLAAAGAQDSTEGLFITDRPKRTAIQCPFSPLGIVQGSFNVCVLPECNPQASPLWERAWAFQEWYLARRLLMFLPEGLVWRCCKFFTYTENGSSVDFGFYEHHDWNNMLESYTGKLLTRPSDRLSALRGVVASMGQSQSNKFSFDYGIWEGDLPGELLWVSNGPHSEASPLQLPSWSWAATGGFKEWYTSECYLECYSDIYLLAKTIELVTTGESSGSIKCAGHVVDIALTLYQNSETHDFRDLEMKMTVGRSILPHVNEEIGRNEGYQVGYSYLIVSPLYGEKFLGIVVFDEDNSSTSAKLFLVQRREERLM